MGGRLGLFVLAFAACLMAGGEVAAEGNVTEAQNKSQHKGHARAPVVNPAECLLANARPSVLCAEVPTPFVDATGRWWLAWTQQGHVYVASRDVLENGFQTPVRVTPTPLKIDKNGENRPKVVIAKNGDAYVSFTAKGKRKYTGVVYFSRSIDGGKTFSAPRPISDEAVSGSQRFEALGVTSSGRIYLAWLDKRDLFAAKAAKRKYRGSGLYYTWSDDRGATFAANTRAADHSCECCRTAMAFDGETPVVAWRHIFPPNLRDHALMRLGEDTQPMRLSIDNWAIDGCPHHGPAISITGKGVQHVVWYTAGKVRSGQFYARSGDRGKSFSEPLKVGNADNQASHPYVLAVGDSVFLAWKEFTGEASELYVMQSADAGRSFSAPLRVAYSNGPADHPFLVSAGGWVHASWASTIEGWRSFRLAPHER